MSDSQGLTDRLAAALERIAAASEGLEPARAEAPGAEASGVSAAGEDPRVAELTEALETERAANAQLEERVRAIMERQDSVVGRLEREVADLKEAMAARDGSVRQVRQANGKLRQANRALRQANAQGVGDAGLINESLEAELEALRAVQAADRAELDDVLATLEPIVGESAHA